MTDIQRESLGFSLCGRDVLGAAKTGSGKTLAFVVPLLEKLYKLKWTSEFGLGALIISPTRELALQIFQVLRKVGRHHELSAGLIIGGKNIDFEKERLAKMNILVATPGRLLQHLDESPNFDCSQLQFLVLDEADRILDLGFKKTVNAILDHLPSERQTLLFSATQTKSVKDLARLSLNLPEYVSVHEHANNSTPDMLAQSYIVCEPYEKLDILFSFIKSHLKSKTLVFLSSCKQVRFVHEVFCKLQPGVVLMCLHGRQKQEKRMVMFQKYCQAKSAVLFCTDIAARGLDFPAVDWVVQVDCPEDVATHIHRVGRTARYNAQGHAISFFMPSEEDAFVPLLKDKKVPLEKVAINPSKTRSIIPQLQGFCAQSPELKYLAEKAFICYLRSIWLQKNKEIFDVSKFPVEDYAASLGLPGTPQIKFVRKLKDQKNQSRKQDIVKENQDPENLLDEGPMGSKNVFDEPVFDFDAVDEVIETGMASTQQKTKLDRMFSKKNQTVLSSHYEKIKARDTEIENEESDDDLLILSRKDHEIDDLSASTPGYHERQPSVRDLRNRKLKNRVKREAIPRGVQLKFDEEGNAYPTWKLETEEEFAKNSDDIFGRHQDYVNAMSEVLQEADKDDKKSQKERIKQKKKRKLEEIEDSN